MPCGPCNKWKWARSWKLISPFPLVLAFAGLIDLNSPSESCSELQIRWPGVVGGQVRQLELVAAGLEPPEKSAGGRV